MPSEIGSHGASIQRLSGGLGGVGAIRYNAASAQGGATGWLNGWTPWVLDKETKDAKGNTLNPAQVAFDPKTKGMAVISRF